MNLAGHAGGGAYNPGAPPQQQQQGAPPPQQQGAPPQQQQQHLPHLPLPPSVRSTLVLCGVPDVGIFDGKTPAQRLASDIFFDDFLAVIDTTRDNITDALKAYASLTVANGRIILQPGVNAKIFAMIQWVRDEVNMSRYPIHTPFYPPFVAVLTARHQTFLRFRSNAEMNAKSSKPKDFKDDADWDTWVLTLRGHLRLIPGRYGAPLSYIIREESAPNPTPTGDFLLDYENNAPHLGTAFSDDNNMVATIFKGLLVSSLTANAKIQSIMDQNNGRLMFTTLRDHYVGSGLFANDITRATNIIETIFYTGEKPPHMWWDKFKADLEWAYNKIQTKATLGRVVYTEEDKLRKLPDRIKADFLAPQMAHINAQLCMIPCPITHDMALQQLQQVVYRKHPPNDPRSTTGKTHVRRNIRETNTGKHDKGDHKKRDPKHQKHKKPTPKGSYIGNKVYDNSGKVPSTRTGSRPEKLKNGKYIEYHPSVNYAETILSQFTDSLRDKMKEDRASYARRNPRDGDQASRRIQELEQRLSDMETRAGDQTQPPPVGHIDTDVQSRISQVTQSTMMGGRNAQAQQRGNTPVPPGGLYDQTGRRIATLISKSVRQVAALDSTPIPNEAPAFTSADNECDSNADTCVLGKNFKLIELTGRVADVYGYKGDEHDAIHIVSGITAYDHSQHGTVLLTIHQALWYGTKMDHSLINPNQLRSYGVPVWDNPFDPTRDIQIEATDSVLIPLQQMGTKTLFNSRSPSDEELQDTTLLRIELTSKRPWDPRDMQVSQISHYSDTTFQPLRVIISETNALPQPVFQHVDPRSDDFDLASVDPLLTAGPYQSINETHYVQRVDSDVPVRRTFISTERHSNATAEALSERFGIGIHRARRTLDATLQNGVRSALLPLERRYRADRRFDKRILKCRMSTDTAYFPVKSLHGKTCSQIYYEKGGFYSVYHMAKATGDEIGDTLPALATDFGIPEHLTMDGFASQVGQHTKMMKYIRRSEIAHHISHPRRPNENPAEGGIRELKRHFYRLQHKYQVPLRLWDYLLSYTSEILTITVNTSRYSAGRTPLERITGITPDITEYLDFHFYEWCWYKTNAGLGPRLLGRWLGVSHRRGPAMTYWILPDTGSPISCDSVQRVTNAELLTDNIKAMCLTYTETITPLMDAAAGIIPPPAVPVYNLFDFQNEEQDFLTEFNRVVDDQDLPHDDDKLNDLLDTDDYVGMIIGRRRDPELPPEQAHVKRRAVDNEGRPIGKAHPTNNPLLDSRVYEVEYDDGFTEAVAANVLAENILAQVDEDGFRRLMLDEIVDHRIKPDAIPRSQGTYTTASGTTRRVHTTRGWELYVSWKDSSATWIALKDLKESYPVELARYAKQHDLLEEPAFAWWAHHALKKCERILKKVKSKYWERTSKYGIEMPKSTADAKRIDAENGNTLWTDAIRLEMTNLMVAFQEYDDNPEDLVAKGFVKITGHLVFDVKLGENFRRKARFCADGHKVATPASITYSSVVSRDSVRILLMIAALNELELRAADIQNAFLTAPNLEKCFMIAGDEFGPNKGKCYIVRRALYGLKSASAAFRSFLADKLDQIGFKSSLADPDVWMRPAAKPDGTRYYSYILCYVDDILTIDVDAEKVMKEIGDERFKFKNDKIAEPDTYLGAKIKKRALNGRDMWTISSDDYVKAALGNIQPRLEGTQWRLPKGKIKTPLSPGYHPETDETDELEDQDVTLYQELVGIIRWATEIGRVDVLHEVAIMSQYQGCPREGHLKNLLQIIAFWRDNPRISLYMDPSLPNVDYTSFVTNREEFLIHYRDAKEQLPPDAPTPFGHGVSITCFVDASHGANKKTRRSHTGYIIFLNRAPVLWYSKRQATVEASTFSSEFIALKTCIEAITALRYKLRMFGIPIADEGEINPAHIFCDNETVTKNSTLVESTLNKKHSSIAYHYVRWNVAAGLATIAWIPSGENLSDPFTKILNDTARDYLFGNWTY
jgi:Reverse transcriptase (RNA-dependent DNA polymerase)